MALPYFGRRLPRQAHGMDPGQPSLRSGFRDDAGRRCNFLLPRPPPRLAIVKERTSFAEVGKTGGHVDARWNKICDRMAARPACAPQSAAGIARTGSGPLPRGRKAVPGEGPAPTADLCRQARRPAGFVVKPTPMHTPRVRPLATLAARTGAGSSPRNHRHDRCSHGRDGREDKGCGEGCG